MNPHAERDTAVGLVGAGALAGALAALIFTAVHHLLINPIWFALPAMLAAGALCGAGLAWSYRLVVAVPSPRTWLGFNLLYLCMFAVLGGTSLLVFEPVTTIAALLKSSEPPRDLIARALPMTALFSVAFAVILGVIFRPSWHGMLALLSTTVVLVLVLGLNISVLGFVDVPNSQCGVLGETFSLLIVLAGAYAGTVLWVARSRFARRPSA